MPGTIIHQQLLLIGYVVDDPATWQKWPQLSGLSTDESRRVFDLMQDLNWVVGFPYDGWLTFKLTDQGSRLLSNLAQSGVAAVPVELPDEQLATVSGVGGNRVFVVHSDDPSTDGLAVAVKDFIIGATGKDAAMLSPTPGQTLWEEFEKQASDCGAAVCVWSADRDNPDSLCIRPNVLLETGYFMARLGKGKVIVIKENDQLHSPSDLAGIVWATKDNWRAQLPRALYEAFANQAQR